VHHGPNGCGKIHALKLLAAVARGEGTAGRSSVARTSTKATSISTSARSIRKDGRRRDPQRARGLERGPARVNTRRGSASTGTTRLRRVSSFSGGGEHALGARKLLLEPRNLLFLDEPTNPPGHSRGGDLGRSARRLRRARSCGSRTTAASSRPSPRARRASGQAAFDLYDGGFKDYAEAKPRKLAADKSSRRAATRQRARTRAAEAERAKDAKARRPARESPNSKP